MQERHAPRAFSGEGARRYGGRWNSPGRAVVYLSEHRSLAALEVLVHTRPLSPRYRYVVFRVEWDENLMEAVHLQDLPADWTIQPPHRHTMLFGDEWLRSRRSTVLAVPSAIVPDERNFLLNPAHPHFTQIAIEAAVEFVFDQRLQDR